MNILRDLLFLNLTLQIFERPFFHIKFFHSARKRPIHCGCRNIELGRDLRLAYTKNFGLFAAAADFRTETPGVSLAGCPEPFFLAPCSSDMA